MRRDGAKRCLQRGWTPLCHRHFIGFGLIEFMVALLIFTLSVNALMVAQLAVKRLHNKALQHTMAVTLASDMYQRIGANVGAVSSYQMVYANGGLPPIEPPAIDCRVARCLPAELAHYDLWDWYSRLLGNQELRGGEPVAPFKIERACVQTVGGVVAITLIWRGRSPVGTDAAPDCVDTSDEFLVPTDETSVFDAGRYQQLRLSGYVGAAE